MHEKLNMVVELLKYNKKVERCKKKNVLLETEQISCFDFCRAEYSYSGAASFPTTCNKTSKPAQRPNKETQEPLRQFGRNAYV